MWWDDCAAFMESHRNQEMQPKPIVFVKPLAGRDDRRREWRSQKSKTRKKAAGASESSSFPLTHIV